MANILVVDDEEDIVQLMSETLSLWGHQTVTAMDGEQALDKFQESRPVDLHRSEIAEDERRSSTREIEKHGQGCRGHSFYRISRSPVQLLTL